MHCVISLCPSLTWFGEGVGDFGKWTARERDLHELHYQEWVIEGDFLFEYDRKIKRLV